jgi:citronellol/citronellal dehydrogenase
MSWGSRGIGLAIALRLSREGANIALLAKTDQPHPKLPGTMIDTAAVRNGLAIDPDRRAPSTRTPEIMADAAHAIVSTPGVETTGRTLIDEDGLRDRGVTDFSRYLSNGANESDLEIDLFV